MKSVRQSQLLSKTKRFAPKDEVSKNASLLIRAGYIHKEMAGVYDLLPLGLKVIEKIGAIIREEMNALGGQELLLSTLQNKELWQKTNRWSDAVVDNWFKSKLKNDTEVGLGFTHEEPLTALLKEHVQSFRDLPLAVYQIQTKFRNEERAKSGIMRGREFLMKDLYSFNKSQQDHDQFYEKVKAAYGVIFNRVGIGEKTHLTYASGGTFSKFSHEFQTLTNAGEDTIYICSKCGVAVNEEVKSETCPQCANTDFKKEKAVEVGNIFNLGTRFSEVFDLTFADETGLKKPVIMGSYGIGLGRLMGTIVETLSDDGGIVWPESVAPFKIHLIALADASGAVANYAEKLYKRLDDKGIEVLYDDRDLRPGQKFADSDLLGIPYRIVVSEKNLADGLLEIKIRKNGEIKRVREEELVL